MAHYYFDIEDGHRLLHEANKADAENAKAQAPTPSSKGDGKN
jgi:hypothetical protein